MLYWRHILLCFIILNLSALLGGYSYRQKKDPLLRGGLVSFEPKKIAPLLRGGLSRRYLVVLPHIGWIGIVSDPDYNFRRCLCHYPLVTIKRYRNRWGGNLIGDTEKLFHSFFSFSAEFGRKGV